MYPVLIVGCKYVGIKKLRAVRSMGRRGAESGQLPKEHWSLERKAQEVFVDPYTVELAKNGTNIIWRYSKNKQFLFYAQGRGPKIEPATPFWSLKYKCP